MSSVAVGVRLFPSCYGVAALYNCTAQVTRSAGSASSATGSHSERRSSTTVEWGAWVQVAWTEGSAGSPTIESFVQCYWCQRATV